MDFIFKKAFPCDCLLLIAVTYQIYFLFGGRDTLNIIDCIRC